MACCILNIVCFLLSCQACCILNSLFLAFMSGVLYIEQFVSCFHVWRVVY